MEIALLQDENSEKQNIVDITMKALMRRSSEAIFDLAGIKLKSLPVLLEDTSISIPELRADQVFLIGEKGDPERGAIYMEYQLHPKREDLSRWFTKCGGLTYQLGCQTALFVLYLTKGDSAAFPEVYETSVSGISNSFRFQTLRIWEHAEEIERGDFPELAPLLILCQKYPTLETVRRQIAIITESDLETAVRRSLFSMVMSMASREFSRNLLKTLFQKEIDMGLYETVYDDWIREAEKRAEDRGEARGEENAARRYCLQVLNRRLGVLPDELIESVNNSSIKRCEFLLDEALKIESLSELDWRL